MPVETLDGKLRITLFEYLADHQRIPWWNFITGAPLKLLGWATALFKGKEPQQNKEGSDPFQLTGEQESFLNSLRRKITVRVDKKSGVLAGSTVMQDPLVSAMVMDSVLSKLQQYIIDYRTRKAKREL